MDKKNKSDSKIRTFPKSFEGLEETLFDIKKNKGTDVVWSPESLLHVLCLASLGMKDDSRAESAFSKLFRGGPTDSMISDLISKRRQDLLSHKGAIRCTNAILLSKEYEKSSVAKEALRAGASLQLFVPSKENAVAVATVNSLVSRETNNMIPQMLEAEDLLPETKVLYVNALYFDCDWREEFEPKKTKSNKFFLPSGTSLSIDFMNMQEDFRCWSAGEKQFLSLPYQGNGLAMMIVQSSDRSSVRVPKSLSREELRSAVTQCGKAKQVLVNVRIPTWKSTCTVPVQEAMEASEALARVFEARQDNIDKDVKVKRILQKVVVSVNERGTTAAAATVAAAMKESCIMPSKPKEAIDFISDRAFHYYILDVDRRYVLFHGTVSSEASFVY